LHVAAHGEDDPQEAVPDFGHVTAAGDSGPEDGRRAELVVSGPEEVAEGSPAVHVPPSASSSQIRRVHRAARTHAAWSPGSAA
jgi:hypothetical protein